MIGKTISHYKVLEKIGQGGMGEVYRAEDTNLSREIAIKVLPEQFTKDPQRLARFEREAKLLASLNHPNIAAIYGLEEADGVRFLALELVSGDTLQERVAKGPLPVEEALEVCLQIAEGVEAAHEKGVIHRDLKPANVKVTPEGKVKILDFGLAKAFEAETPVTDISQSPTLTEEMTRAGVILGTAAYMSPEQAKGEAVDKRADIFAFGCVLYELLTGKRTFDGKTITETLGAIIHKEPDWAALPSTTPWRIQELLRRCLTKDAHDRLRDVAHVRVEVKLALYEPAGESPTGVTSAVQLRGQRWGMTVGLVVLALAVGGMVTWLLIQPSLPEQSLNRFVIRPSPPVVLASSLSNEVAISPDGRQLVYKGVEEGLNQLYLRSLDDFVDRPIPGTANPGSVFFSPDGKSIGFFAGGELKKTSLAGGSPITLCNAALGRRTGDWFEDTIVFTAGGDSGRGLYQVSANGGEPEMLATANLDEGEIGYAYPQVLPDGRDVLFTIYSGREYQTGLLSLETGERKVVLENARQARYLSTGHLVYEQGVTGNLMVVPFDLAALEVTGDSVTVVQAVRQLPDASVDYALSDEGTLVYVPGQITDVQSLVWVDRKGTESVITQEDVSFATPRISPNGKQVGVALSREGETQNIWIYDLEDESLRRLTFEGGSIETWSPDSKWIIFAGRDSEGLRNISRQLADGSGPIEQLTVPNPILIRPSSLTPDGSVLAVDAAADIWMFPMEGDSEPQPFITSPNQECCSKFSPDGRWLAYVSNELGLNHVYVSPYPNPEVKYLVSEEVGGTEPVWSPDGHELFYRSGTRMMVASVQTEPTFRAGRPEVLFEGSVMRTRIGTIAMPYYDISPDGQRFLMIKQAGAETQINVVLNWFEELKRLVPTP